MHISTIGQKDFVFFGEHDQSTSSFPGNFQFIPGSPLSPGDFQYKIFDLVEKFAYLLDNSLTFAFEQKLQQTIIELDSSMKTNLDLNMERYKMR